jgi:hypothetical protein
MLYEGDPSACHQTGTLMNLGPSGVDATWCIELAI